MADSTRLAEAFVVLIACGLFITLGVLFIPLAGIQTDEAIFTGPIYEHFSPPFFSRILHLQVPAMLMSYLGTLKTILYYPIFKIWGANVWSLRLPMLLLGAITIFIFYRLARTLVSPWAALLGAFLLATDPVVFMTSTFDWGPVAIEHLLLVTACLCMCRFGSEETGGIPKKDAERWLAAACFCLGLALWNKAIFAWALAGLVAASVATLWAPLCRIITLRKIAIAGGALVLGAAPLIIYNLRHPGATVQQNAQLLPSEVSRKWPQVKLALQGSSLFGYIASDESRAPSKAPMGTAARASAWLREELGARRSSGFYYVLGGLFALVPLWWRSRTAWFALVFSLVAWLAMALTHNAGDSAHHVVLIWPFPILFAVAVLDRLPKLLSASTVVVVVLMNLTVVNQYLFQLNQNGPGVIFTDAIFPLSGALEEHPDQKIYLGDWGMVDSLNFLHQGRLDLRQLGGQLNTETPTPYEAQEIRDALADRGGLLVSHTIGNEIFPDVNKNLVTWLDQEGVRREVLRVINDSNGRPIFEISRIVEAR